MWPTLREPDMLEIVPYGGRPVRVGDVVFFTPPEGDRSVVHRVVRVTPPGATPGGIRTRGDNNSQDDAHLLQSTDITGRVVAAWRGQRRRKIAGGRAGWLASYLFRWRGVLDRRVSQLLHAPYRALARWGIVRRLLPACLRPRVVEFRVGGQSQLQLLLGKRVAGRYDARRRQWHIQRPFRLFVDESVLPEWVRQHATLWGED